MTRDIEIKSENVRILDKENKKENEVEKFAEYKYNGEWFEFSFGVDYEQYLDKERLKGHAEMWARKNKARKISEE